MAEVSLQRGESPNATNIIIGDMILVFSYETCVAFKGPDGWVVSENVWSKATGKHLNQEVPKTAKRIPYPEFSVRLRQAIARISVAS